MLASIVRHQIIIQVIVTIRILIAQDNKELHISNLFLYLIL